MESWIVGVGAPRPTGQCMKNIEASLADLYKVVDYINETIPANAIIFLTGDLASGKTTLAGAIAKSKGIEGEITSPTFSLQNRYAEGIFHYDLYRIDFEEFVSLGLFEELDNDGWHLIEWGRDKLKATLVGAGYECYEVDIGSAIDKSAERIYKIGKLNA